MLQEDGTQSVQRCKKSARAAPAPPSFGNGGRYRRINPLGKVPALVVRNVAGFENAILYESAAVAEYVDEALAAPGTPLAFSDAPGAASRRDRCRHWLAWEMALADDFGRLSRQQVDAAVPA